MTIESDLTWLKAHLVLLALVVILVFGSVYGIESLIARHDTERESKDQANLSAIQANSASLQQRLQQDEVASAARDAQYQQIISQLSATIASQNVTLAKQIKTNATLTPVETAAAIAKKTNAASTDVIAQNDTVTLSSGEAKKINNALDTLTTVQAELVETQKEVLAQTDLTAEANNTIAEQKAVIASQESEIKAGDKVCEDRITVVTAKARRGKLKAFFWGVLVGMGVRQAL